MSKIELWELQQMQSLPLDAKVAKTLLRLQEWYDYWEGQVYISFSGGVDSTVLLHLARSLHSDFPAAFINTGVEYPEIVSFVKSHDNIDILRPNKTYKEVVEKWGYPVVSKEISKKIWGLRCGNTSPLWKARYLAHDSPFCIPLKWRYLLDSPFPISSHCCGVLKKQPAEKYERSTGRKLVLGNMVSDSLGRRTAYTQTGCNFYDSRRPISKPLSFWYKRDVLNFIQGHSIPYCSVYGQIKDGTTTGIKTTGCIYCMFGAHREKCPNRFQQLKLTHPRLWAYMLAPDGLNQRPILDYLRIPYE